MFKHILLSSVIASSTFLLSYTAQACTRVVYQGNNQNILTARSMDWKSDVGTNLWILPSGIKRSGNSGKTPSSGRLNTEALLLLVMMLQPQTVSTKQDSTPIYCGWWNHNIQTKNLEQA